VTFGAYYLGMNHIGGMGFESRTCYAAQGFPPYRDEIAIFFSSYKNGQVA